MRRPRIPSHAVRAAAALAAVVVAATGCSSGAAPSSRAAASTAVRAASTSAPAASSGATAAPASRTITTARWHPAHVVVVLEENHSYGDIVGAPDAPYLNRLAAQGVSLTHMSAVTHPSEPNYLALFSGSTQGLTDDSCPHTFGGAELAGQLAAAHLSFAGYAQGLPAAGATDCTAGAYARKHAPWTDFRGLDQAAIGRPFSAFPADLRTLPTVAFVVPDLAHDMHDGTVAAGDAWLRTHLSRYAAWARTHDSLLVVTWDEDDRSAGNHIPTFVTGSHVRTGTLSTPADHYRLLRTIEWWLGLPGIGTATRQAPLTALVGG